MDYNKVKPGDSVPCKYCGKDFTAVHYSQHYCNGSCRNKGREYKSKSTIGVCIECGEEFMKKRENNTVCTPCSKTRQNRINRDATADKIRVCKECGKEYRRGDGWPWYCSDECRAIDRRRKDYRWASNYRIDRAVKCKYCKNEFNTALLKKIFCSNDCGHKWTEMMEMFRHTHNVVYMMGYKISDKYYVKVGVAKTFEGRFKRYSTDTPFLLRVFYLRSFNTISIATEYESKIHLNTLHNQTESANEWREFTEDEFINTLIECGKFKEGIDVNIDNKHITQMA